MARISWASLTRTFQDAIDFTRRLGIDYLWIDSMCIIQDDAQDWLKEASMMFSVYNNAHVTLVGVHASDGSGGLYSKGGINQTAFPRPITLKGQDYNLQTREVTALFHDWRQLPQEAPLFTRAWCFQELIISPRVVFFTKKEILWECFSRAACECGDSGMGTSGDGTGGIPTQLSTTPATVDNPKIHHIAAFSHEWSDALRAHIMAHTTTTAFALYDIPSAQSRKLSNEQARREYRVLQWHNVVEQYSELELTKVTDRLPAIGAVAQHYYQRGVRAGETYLAGLWSGLLVEDLMWWAPTVGRRRFGAEVAPSWSWASVSDSVQYHQLKKPLAKILFAECRYEGKTLFAVVLGGTIVLEGSISSLTLRKRAVENVSKASSTSGSQPAEFKWTLEDIKCGEFSDVPTFFIDDEDGPLCEEGRPICAVALAREWGGQTVYLLLAKSNMDPDCYARVGLLFEATTTWQKLTKLHEGIFRII
jgi:hypothetical protein